MTNTLDGFDFDMPPTVSQIVALAQYHRTLLDEAVFHQEIHLGDFCLAQRKRVYDFTRQLDENQRVDLTVLPQKQKNHPGRAPFCALLSMLPLLLLL